jgi:hypothetical protein
MDEFLLEELSVRARQEKMDQAFRAAMCDRGVKAWLKLG